MSGIPNMSAQVLKPIFILGPTVSFNPKMTPGQLDHKKPRSALLIPKSRIRSKHFNTVVGVLKRDDVESKAVQKHRVGQQISKAETNTVKPPGEKIIERNESLDSRVEKRLDYCR